MEPRTIAGPYVMQAEPRPTFADLIRSFPSGLPPERALHITIQVADAVQALHERGVAYPDLTAEKIILAPDDRASILPPAAVLNERAGIEVNPQPDIFSLAVLCYQALTGRAPQFDNPDRFADLTDDRIRVVLLKATEIDPRERFASVSEFGSGLREAFYQIQRESVIRQQMENARVLLDRGDYSEALASTGIATVLPAPEPDPAPASLAPPSPPVAMPPPAPPGIDRPASSSFALNLRKLKDWFASKAFQGSAEDSPRPELPDHTRFDNVHFTITSPGSVTPGFEFQLQFWAHLEEQRDNVRARAQEALPPRQREKLLLASQGPYNLARGSVLSVRLKIDGMEIADNSKLFIWTGEIGVACFVAKASDSASFGPHAGAASICVNGIPVARLDFLIYIDKKRSRSATLPSKLKAHRSAFASYASEDRPQVLARVQGINKVAPQLSVFVDVLSLRSGEYWAQRLTEEIPAHDTFFLFWSRHAKASLWVEKEWRCAYEKRGIDFIDPIPLEHPSEAPPPAELAAKHFNDPLLVFITQASGRAQSQNA